MIRGGVKKNCFSLLLIKKQIWVFSDRDFWIGRSPPPLFDRKYKKDSFFHASPNSADDWDDDTDYDNYDKIKILTTTFLSILIMMKTVLMIVKMILMMMLTNITIITTIFLSILIPDTEMEVLPFYENIAQASSGLSVRKHRSFFDEKF